MSAGDDLSVSAGVVSVSSTGSVGWLALRCRLSRLGHFVRWVLSLCLWRALAACL